MPIIQNKKPDKEKILLKDNSKCQYCRSYIERSDYCISYSIHVKELINSRKLCDNYYFV